MAITLPHIEDSNLTDYIPPNGKFQPFLDEAHYAEKVREWGLSGTKETKKEFWYKDRIYQRLVTIKGYESYGITGEYHTLIIEFQDGHLSCIHPALLKEMQAASYGKEGLKKESPINPNTNKSDVTVSPKKSGSTMENSSLSKKTKPGKEKDQQTPKLMLPEEKVHFTGKVKQFALSWNHFTEKNDEVIVMEDVRIVVDEPIEIALAWCSHSKTLKKYELNPGDTLEFDGKIVKKSLPKGKEVEDDALLITVSIPYKINNPSKIKKS